MPTLTRAPVALALAVALAAPACNEAPAPAAPTATPTTRPAVKTATSVAGLVEAMQSRMKLEAASRPTGTPTVEAVMKALADGGVKVHGGTQSLAALTEADYCWHSRAVDGSFAFSVCEYPSAEAVQKSQNISLTKFPEMGQRTFVVQGHTMMTIKVHKPEGEAEIARIKTIMAGVR